MDFENYSGWVPSPEPIELTIDDLAFGGDGVGRVEGKACFVPGTIPGEVCRVRVVQEKKSFIRAELVEVIESSPDRVTPPCPVAGRCGGCQYQHLSYEAELKWKEKQVRESMARLGGLSQPPLQRIVPSPEPYGYRNRIQIHIRNGRPGFMGFDGRAHVAVHQCPIADEDINRQLEGWSNRPHPNPNSGRLTLVSGQTLSGGFSQVNGRLEKTLRQTVVEAVNGFRVGKLLEFYAGAGFFTRSLTDSHESVTAIEWDRRLVERGRTDVPKANWVEMGVDEALNYLADSGVASDTDSVILLDPPREGLSSAVKAWLANVSAGGIVYLSCNPTTQARDLKELSENYRVVSIQPMDLFPRTAHIESLVRLTPRLV